METKLTQKANPAGRLRARLWHFLPWVWLVLGYAVTVAYLAVYGKTYLHSDMASEMVLANLLNKEGGLLSHNWYYSTELRVVYQQLFYCPALRLFPNNWHMARVLSLAVMLALMAASYLFMAHQAGLSRCGVWSAAALVCPFGFWYVYVVTFSGSYLPHIILMLLSLGLMFRWGRRGLAGWHRITVPLALALVCFAAGLNGVRLLMNCYAPAALAALLVVVLPLYRDPAALQRPENRPARRFLAASLFAAAAGAAGYLVNSRVLTMHLYFQSFNDRTWGDFELGEWISSLSGFFSLFGYEAGTKLFSIAGAFSAAGLVVAAAVVVSAIRLLLRWHTLTPSQRNMVALFWCGLVVDSILFAFTAQTRSYVNTYSISYNDGYWVPLLPVAFAILQIEGETEPFPRPQLRTLATAAFMACVLMTSVSASEYYLQAPPFTYIQMDSAAQWLVNSGYTGGYASFWYGNVMTEQTNGGLEMWVLRGPDSLDLYSWLQSVDHGSRTPEGKTFVLVGPADKVDDVRELPYSKGNGENIVYEQDDITIFSFDSAQQLDEVIAENAARTARLAEESE